MPTKFVFVIVFQLIEVPDVGLVLLEGIGTDHVSLLGTDVDPIDGLAKLPVFDRHGLLIAWIFQGPELDLIPLQQHDVLPFFTYDKVADVWILIALLLLIAKLDLLHFKIMIENIALVDCEEEDLAFGSLEQDTLQHVIIFPVFVETDLRLKCEALVVLDLD